MPASVPLEEVGIEGVHVAVLQVHEDPRGWVAEHYRRSWIPGARTALQANLSRSAPNVLRGLHFHRRQADYWTVLEGEAFIGLYDLRRGSPTEGRSAGFPIASDAFRTLSIPPGVAHGFYTGSGLLLQYLVDEYYTGDDEFGVAWDDPALAVAWPCTDPVLSERDRANPTLARLGEDRPGLRP